MRFVHWLLTETPFYPVQVVAGLCLGWVLCRRLQHRVMVWVWVLPAAILSYVLLTTSALIPAWSALSPAASIQSRLSYYFGWGCRPSARCLDQLLITMPLYASFAYSLGALVAQRMHKQ